MRLQLLKKITLMAATFFTCHAKAQTTYIVNNTNDSGTGSLREAASNAISDDIIKFDPTLISTGSVEITLTSGNIYFGNKAITIKGLYNPTDTLYISGNNSSRIFSFNGAGDVTLDSLVLINGNGSGSINSGNGGAVAYFEGTGTIFINNSTFTGNSAVYDGGGVFSFSQSTASSVMVNNSMFNGNLANFSGGGVSSYSYTSSSSLTVNNSTFSENSAHDGGGVYSYSSPSSSSSSVTVNRSTFNGNAATNNGGGMYSYSHNASSFVTVNNSTFSGNSASNAGEGIYSVANNTSNITIESSIFDGNTISNQGANSITSSGYNAFTDAPIGATNTGDLTNQTINLQPLAFNGGNTKTMLPSLGSFLIDAGNPIDLTDAQNRPIIDGTRDIGAAEYNCVVNEIDTKVICNSTITWLDGITYTSNNSIATHKVYSTTSSICDSVYTLNLTINQPNTGDTTAVVCGTFNWYGTDYTTSGMPTHALTNVNGCDSVVTLNLTINNTDATTTQNGADLFANVTSATYQWVDCDNANAPITGETNQTFTATENGSYAVEVTENGCTEMSDCMTVEGLGIIGNQNGTSQLAKIYPNPITNNVFVQINDANTTNYTVNIYNLVGEIVLTQNINTTTTQINTSQLENGVYFVEINNSDAKQVLRLVKS